MGFNLLSAAAGAVQGAAMGANPLSIGAGALAGGFAGNGATTVGGFSNGAQNLLNGGYLAATEALNAQQMVFQLQLQGQSQQFDQMTSERSELLRETNSLRDVAMQQRKADKQASREVVHRRRVEVGPNAARDATRWAVRPASRRPERAQRATPKPGIARPKTSAVLGDFDARVRGHGRDPSRSAA